MSARTKVSLTERMAEYGFPYACRTTGQLASSIIAAGQDQRCVVVVIEVGSQWRTFVGYYRPDEAVELAETMRRKRAVKVIYAAVVRVER